MGNGLLVFGISILQVLSLCYPALLLSVTTLNVIAASVALFMVSYAISNTYFLAAVLFTVEGFHWVIIEVVLILTACASTACVICTFCSTFAIVRINRTFSAPYLLLMAQMHLYFQAKVISQRFSSFSSLFKSWLDYWIE
uniref:Bm13201 n=1 Tax=Brugia malayi TaxID=6279 RepID=A0A1I9GBU1_BRUMA|nr:Bm13201 [Brugia malayi]